MVESPFRVLGAVVSNLEAGHNILNILAERSGLYLLLLLLLLHLLQAVHLVHSVLLAPTWHGTSRSGFVPMGVFL